MEDDSKTNKSKDPAVLLYVDTWLTSTASMSADCRGWYINLLCHNHDKGELPNDIEELGLLANVRFSDFERFNNVWVSELKKKFVEKENGMLSNPKLETIMQTRQRFIEKRSMAGKIGVLVKTTKLITKDADEIDFIKSKIEQFESVLPDRDELKQMIKQVLKLYRNEDKTENKDRIGFEEFWIAYDKKVGKKDKVKKKWDLLSIEEQEAIMVHIPRYKSSQPDKQYRKNPETYLNNKSWEDEIITTPSNNNGFSVGQKVQSSHDKQRSY